MFYTISASALRFIRVYMNIDVNALADIVPKGFNSRHLLKFAEWIVSKIFFVGILLLFYNNSRCRKPALFILQRRAVCAKNCWHFFMNSHP